ncbi:MAG TPA: hypothetical protein VFW00_00490 [Rhodocyclaceae bacterium]|nr:hypothetical protein [Rhodocyclaceae bacterium]
MKALQIDFSGRSRLFALNAADPVCLIYVGLLVLGIALVGSGAAFAMRLNTQSSRLAKAIAQIESTTQRARDETAAQNSQLSTEETEAINAAVIQLNYPWLSLFKGLEEHAKPGISLISIETGAQRESAKIVVDAPGIDDALSYVQGLKVDPVFSSMSLVKQETVNLGNNVNVMRFTLEAPSSTSGRSTSRRGGS